MILPPGRETLSSGPTCLSNRLLSTCNAIVPYLTSPDLNVRLRAVDVILARYPDGSLPPKVSQLTAKILDSAGSNPTNQTEETKSLIASAVQQLPARVYLQIHDEAQRPKAIEIQALLRQQGLLAPDSHLI